MRDFTLKSLKGLFVNGLASVSAILIGVILGRLYGAEITGLYYLTISVGTGATFLARFGLDLLLMRKIAAPWAMGRHRYVRSMILRTTGMMLVTGIAVGLSLWLVAPILAADVFHRPDLAQPLRLVAFGAPMLALVYLAGQALRGMQYVALGNGISDALSRVFISAALAGLILIGLPASTGVAVSAYLLGSGLALLLGATVLVARLRAVVRGRVPSSGTDPDSDGRDLKIRETLPFLWITLIEFVFTLSPVLVGGVFLSATSIGILSVAMRLALVVSFVHRSISLAIAPDFAVLHQKNEIHGIRGVFFPALIVSVVAGMPVAGVLFIFAPGFLAIFGADFVDGSLALRILVVGQLVNAATGAAGQYLMMTGRERLLRSAHVASGLFIIACLLVLTPRFGLVGAAVSVAVTVGLRNLFLLAAAVRNLPDQAPLEETRNGDVGR